MTLKTDDGRLRFSNDPEAAIKQAGREIANLERTCGGRTLAFYHQVGKLVASLDERPGSKYGKEYVRRLAEELAEQKINGIGKITLHKCSRFYRSVNVAQLHTLQQLRLAWRSAIGLTSDNLREGLRDQLIEQLRSGELQPRELGKKIRAGLRPRARAGTKSALSAYRRAAAAIEQLRRAERLGNAMAAEKLAELQKQLKAEP
jgi:hypothetical protein